MSQIIPNVTYTPTMSNITSTLLPGQNQTFEAPISPPVMYTIFAFNGFMAILGCLGNIFVCMVIVRGRKMYTIANLFLLNLAVADMSVTAVSYPLWVLQTFRYVMLCYVCFCSGFTMLGTKRTYVRHQ